MKNSKNGFENAGQSINEVKKSQKHDANLQKNSTLYFQIGLILCLFCTYGLFEMQFQGKSIVIDSVEPNELATIDVAPIYKVEPVKPVKPELKVIRSTKVIDVIKVEKNDAPDIEAKIFTPDAPEPTNKPAKVGEFEVKKVKEDVAPIPFILIEKVPVYPGCEKYDENEDRKKCMSEKITKLINRKFNQTIASDYGISGRQRITTQFTIDKLGNVTDLKIRAPHPALKKEAARLINKIPQMQPGLQRNVPVGVIYTLPIVFDARD